MAAGSVSGFGGNSTGSARSGGQEREPVGNMVQWIEEPGNPGCMYYSKPFPVEEGATYRFQIRVKSFEPKPIVFIKCSDVFDTDFHPTPEGFQEGYADKFGRQTREVYRSQHMLFHYPKNEWTTHMQDFTPRHTKYSPKFGRVMLYAYWFAGKVWFDDVVIKKIADPDPEELKKTERRLSAPQKDR